jgi:DNA-3-methyladenine glycosylase I
LCAVSQTRCAWSAVNPLMIEYHDREWGVPVHDDRKHFEFLVLEAAQAGLSWAIVLNKREGYRKAFAQFDPEKVARFDKRRVDRLVLNPAIVRNRQKIEAAIKNARALLRVQDEFGSFDAYAWRFVGGAPRVNRRGFSFVGSTVIYAHMQAIGMVNDHVIDCFRYRELLADTR